MSRKNVPAAADSVVIRDQASRRQFMRAGAGFLLIGGASIASRKVQAGDCDRGGQQRSGEVDQDAGEGADPKGCKSENIISDNQPERSGPVFVRRVKA